MTCERQNSLSQALRLFKTQGGRDHLIRTLEQMSADEAAHLAPLLHEAIDLENTGEAFLTTQRLLDAHPAWMNTPHGDDATTPLMVALRAVRLDIVDLLVQRGANLLAHDRKGWTALDVAVDVRRLNHRISEALVDSVLETGAFGAHDKSFSLVEAVRQRNVGAVRSLLKHGADASFQMKDSLGSEGAGNTVEVGNALVAACNMAEDDNSIKIMDMLLANARVRQVLNDGWGQPGLGAPIHCACYNENPQLLARLAKAGAWINPPAELAGHGCETPLMSAAWAAAPEIMAWLLGHGADAGCVDDKGANAFHYLARAEIDHGAARNAQIFQVAFDLLMRAGCDPLLEDKEGNTPLALAQAGDIPSLVRLFGGVEQCHRLEQGTAPAMRAGKAGGPRL